MLVLSADGKGVVIRPDALRPATAKAANTSRTKLATRLSNGEKRNRKRMAEPAAGYDLAPVPRTGADILPTGEHTGPPPQVPQAKNKMVTASVVDDAATVIAVPSTEPNAATPTMPAAGSRSSTATTTRSPGSPQRPKPAASRSPSSWTSSTCSNTWGGAWCFYDEGDAAAEAWVRQEALAVLDGKAGIVAASIRRKAIRSAGECTNSGTTTATCRRFT